MISLSLIFLTATQELHAQWQPIYGEPMPMSISTQDSTQVKKKRPKIAVVLAGGGAKGVAHVAALKAIEDAGLPVDMLVGTSMGSIVGGAYCAGYSPDTMRTIIKNTDWVKLISDNPDYGNQTLSGKKDDENYQLRVRIDPLRIKSTTGKGGLIEGYNVMKFFHQLFENLPDSMDYGDLPIPFACVGTRAVDGGCKVFTTGNLPMSIRASMAIPTAFTPVNIYDTVYVDGGVCDNFPVDVARSMGADIVIGVDLIVQRNDKELANSAMDLLMNCIDFYSQDLQAKNRADADVYIPIDVTGFTAASFAPEHLDTLMARGDYYVSLKKHELDSLRQTIELEEGEPYRIRLGEYTYATTRGGESSWGQDDLEARESLIKVNGGLLNSSVSIGGRADRWESASIQAKANVVLSSKKATLLTVAARLGARREFKFDFSTRTFGTQRIGINYKNQLMDVEYYTKGTKDIFMELNLNKVNLYLSQEWRKIKYTFGVNYNRYHYQDILVSNPDDIRKIIGENKKPQYRSDGTLLPDSRTSGFNRYFSYYMKSELNTLNTQYFPTRGHRLEIAADVVTDNLYQYKDAHPLLIGAIDWKSVIRVSSKTMLIPHASGRVLFSNGEEEPWSVKTKIGGIFDEMYHMHQRTMAGVYRMEHREENAMAIGGMTIQHELFKNQFVQLRGDACTYGEKVEDATNNLTWGIECSYDIRTSIGPVGIKMYWSEMTKRFDVNINAGYYF